VCKQLREENRKKRGLLSFFMKIALKKNVCGMKSVKLLKRGFDVLRSLRVKVCS
jgi:hypothetical protein